jgi:CzcA family heavy metal efflux pump
MKLAHFAVNRPVATQMIFMAIVFLGLVSLLMLGIDLLPDVEIPAVSVITVYDGAGPQEVERLVTEPIEDVLSTISGVNEVVSVSQEDTSTVTLRFKWGQELTEAVNEVREKIDLIKESLPEEAGNPVIFKFDLERLPIMVIPVVSKDRFANLHYLVEDQVANPLKRVKGVASATVRGGMIRQIRVEVDHDRLSALNLSFDQIQAALAAQNMSIPGGRISSGRKDFLLRTPEEFTSPDEVGQVVIARRPTGTIKLRDVAQVKDGFQERRYDVDLNGNRVVAILIQKQSGSNTVKVSRAVREKLTEIETTLPLDVKPQIIMDSSEFILASVATLRDAVFWAILFVFLVLMFFLRDMRAAVIVAVAIPVSLIITFLLMLLAGYTINTISLASLAVAVGLVVDNAIVVVDNIHRHHREGRDVQEGAIYGTNEVGMAVTASTLTTVSIFIPIVFVGGLTAILFRQFAAIVTMALVASLLTSLMLVPMMCSTDRQKRPSVLTRGPLALFYRMSGAILAAMEHSYMRFLNWALGNRRTVCFACVVFFVWSIGAIPFVGTEFFPRQDQDQVSAEFELPIGTRFEQSGRVARQLREITTAQVPERRDCYTRWGSLSALEAEVLASEAASHTGYLLVVLQPKIERSVTPGDIVTRLRAFTDKIPGAEIRFNTRDPFDIIFSSQGRLSVELVGHDMVRASEYAQAVSRAIEQVQGVSDIRISRKAAKPEVKVVVDREKASLFDLSSAHIGKTIEAYFAGVTATRYREGGNEFDVRIRLRPEDRQKVEDLRDITIRSPKGPVCLSTVAVIEHGLGPGKIERKDQARYITVSAEVYGRDLGSVVDDVQGVLDAMSVPPGFSSRFTGAEKEKNEAFLLLAIAVCLGMVLVYMVMAAQFESFRDPFIIFLSIPFSIVGVIVALAVTGQSISVVGFIGVIMLVGIVVNDGIVLISYINLLRQRGNDLPSAIRAGGKHRLRPVVCTSCTTILAMLPLALSRGAGSEIWMPFGVTVIGGLLVATLITLVLMPTLYSLFEEL